jgi:hypothetical protein
MANIKRYHRVTVDTPNSTHDKRCRYGIRSVEVIPRNSIITEYIELASLDGKEVPLSSYIICIPFGQGNKIDSLTREEFETLPTAPHQLSPLEEYNMEYSNLSKDAMIREFLARGLLKIETIREYYTRPD